MVDNDVSQRTHRVIDAAPVAQSSIVAITAKAGSAARSRDIANAFAVGAVQERTDLLHRQIGVRPLFPGALLATIVIGGASATSPLFLGSWLTADAKYFGSFGVVLALLSWAFILVTLSMVCAILSPVWGEWRTAEKRVPVEAGPAASRAAADI